MVARLKLPREPGSYLLGIRLDGRQRVAVGRLGVFDLQPGFYLYAGSALNGLRGRVDRHLRRTKRTHWHIDHLTAIAPVTAVWWNTGEDSRECA